MRVFYVTVQRSADLHSILESDGRLFAFSYYNLLNIEQHSIKQA
jgi:hypothetical protein